MKPVYIKISPKARKGWTAFAKLASVTAEELLDFMGVYLAGGAERGTLEEDLRNLLESHRGPQVVVANGAGAQAAGRDIVNAVVEEHVVPEEFSKDFVEMLLAALRNGKQPVDWWGNFVKARQAQRRDDAASSSSSDAAGSNAAA